MVTPPGKCRAAASAAGFLLADGLGQFKSGGTEDKRKNNGNFLIGRVVACFSTLYIAFRKRF